jgi:CubicO group peptidase (beta-lactamase class C family)
MKIHLVIIIALISVFNIFAQKAKNFEIVSGELGAKLDGHLAQLVAERSSPARFSRRKKRKIFLKKVTAWRTREHTNAYAPETVSTSGSITKQFTGAAILKLEMQASSGTTDKIAHTSKTRRPTKQISHFINS